MAQDWGENLKEWTIAAVVIGIFLALCGLALYPFRRAPLQAADVFYRAEWILAHWSDLPKKTSICAAPFCLRTDTEKRYVGGNPGHMSETTYYLCSEHEPPFPYTKSRYDDLLRFIYFGLSFVISLLLALLALGPPILLVAAIVSRVRIAASPDADAARIKESGMEAGAGIAALIGIAATVGAWFLYGWF